MSDFVMGAEARLTDNFSQTFSNMARATKEFDSGAAATAQAVDSMGLSMSQGTQDAKAFRDTLNTTATDTAAVTASMDQATAGTNKWKAAMQQFNRGTETIKGLPSTLKQVAAQKLDGLQNSFIRTRMEAGLLVGGVKTLAKTKVTSLVDNFKEFKATVTEGKSGLAGFASGLKNVGKISLAASYNAIKNITDKTKDFAKTKISNITNGFKEFKNRVTQGQSGTGFLLTSLKNVAKVSLTGLHNGLSKIGSLAVSAGSKIASSLGSAITSATKGLTIGIAAAGTAMAGLTVKALNLGGELEQNIGGSEAVFKEFASTMQETGKTAFSKMGLSQSDFLATANKMGALFQGSGFGIKESADISAKSMQRAADVASIMGIDVGDAMEAVAGAAKGNFTMMDNLGVAMNDTAIAAYAASKGIKKSSQQMTQQEKVGLAMEMFLEKTSYAAGNYAKENDTLAGSLTTAKAAMSNFLAGSGSVDDLVSSFVNASTIIVDNVTEIVPRLATGVAEAIGAIMPKVPGILIGTLPMLLNAATQMFQSLITTVQQNKQPLIGLAVTIISSLATFLLDAIPQILLVGADILLGLADGITQQLPQLLSVAGQSINSFVSGVITRFPMLIQTALQLIQTLVNGLIANLPMIIQSGVQLIVSLVQGIVGMLPSLVQMAVQLIMSLVQGLIANLPLILNAAVQLIVTLIQGIVGMLPMIIQSGIQLIITLFQGLIANLPMIIQAAIQIIIALAFGLIQAIPQLVAAIPQLISAIVDTIMNTNWLQVGWDIVKGIGKGLFDGIKSIFKKGGKAGGEEMASGAAEGAESGLTAISEASAQTANNFTANLQPDYSAISGYGMEAGNSLSAGLTTGAEGIGTTATQIGTDAMLGLSGGFTAALPDTVATVSDVGLQSVTGLSTGMTDNLGLATTAATTVTTGVTDTFADINLRPSGENAMQGFIDGMNAMRSSVMGVAREIADSVKTTINSSLDIHSPSRVLEESGEFTGEGFANGILAMIDRVKSAARGLSDGAVEPFATQATSVQAISPSGVSSVPAGKRDGLKIAIENIILQDVGDKDPKALVAEILQLLYDALSGADEVLSAGEMGALL